MHLCGQFPVCWSQPLKEGDAKGGGPGLWGGGGVGHAGGFVGERRAEEIDKGGLFEGLRPCFVKAAFIILPG